MFRNFCIYVHTNSFNGKRYVGWAKITHKHSPHQAMMRRWRRHVSDSRNGSRYCFHRAIQKYPLDVWNHDIIDVLSTKDSTFVTERLWIEKLSTYRRDNPDKGYNETKGGEGSVGSNMGRTLSDSWRSKIGNKRQGKKHSVETKMKIGLAHKGRPKSSSHKEKIRLAKTGKKMSPSAKAKAGQHFRKSVIQKDKIGNVINEYSSIKDATLATGVLGTNISRVCRGERKSAGGFVWSFVERVKL